MKDETVLVRGFGTMPRSRVEREIEHLKSDIIEISASTDPHKDYKLRRLRENLAEFQRAKTWT